MDREETIELLKKYEGNKLELTDAISIISKYVAEKKPNINISKLNILLSYLGTPAGISDLHYCLKYIFHEFRCRHEINYIENGSPYAANRRTVVLIY